MKKIVFNTFLLSIISANTPVSYINSIRVNCGTIRLKSSNILSYAAKKHAIYLYANREFTHTENIYSKNYYASEPWQRVAKAGYATRAVVENISFYERNFKSSIDKIMGTVYHRLAFLDTKIDTIGVANYRGVYVYDMSNSKLSNLCLKKQTISKEFVSNICKNSNKKIPISKFNSAINRTRLASKGIIFYPYRNQVNVGLNLVTETPKFINSRGYGFPITVQFNNSYYNRVSLLEFKLFSGKREIPSKIVTFGNDRAKKLKKNCFVLLPLKKLHRSTRYRVLLKVLADGKSKKLSWSFKTR